MEIELFSLLVLSALLLFFDGVISVRVSPESVCPANEVYSDCGNNACQNTCANPTISQVSKCSCKPGCICIPGYLRNSKGVCVPTEKCDACGANEMYSECNNHGCQDTCTKPDLSAKCTYVAGCYPGCICLPGFLRNKERVCVPKDTCISNCIGSNEVYTTCGTACPRTCENKNDPIICPDQCVVGCFCRDGYVRDKNNKCILPQNCPLICGLNEVLNPCINPCPTGTQCFAPCIAACECKVGYVRDTNKNCVKKIEKCPANEVYSDCGNTGCINTCSNLTFAETSKCPCNPGCVCIAGYVRNSKKVCVPPKQCGCPANEVYSDCGNTGCVNTCANPTFAQISKCICNPGCICIPGYLRNSKGLCVPPKQCGCPTNEVYSECGNTGCVNTCANPTFAQLSKCACNPGCICIAGYLRNSKGVCIPPKQC